MNKTFSLLLILFILSTIIICQNNNDEKLKEKKNDKKNGIKKDKNKDKDKNNSKDLKNGNKKEKENNENGNEEMNMEEEEEDDQNYPGIYMNQKTYEEKFDRIFEKRNLKLKKKITIEKLKTIFEEIYEEELKDKESAGTGMTPQEEGQQYLDLIFNELIKGYDYDDKINVKEIKKLMAPKQTRDAMFTVYANLAESLGYL